MSIDTIGDFLTIIRNGLMASKRFVIVPSSRMRLALSKILKDEGFINDYVAIDENGKKAIQIFLKYADGESVIHEIKRISKPGRRMYAGSDQIPPVVGKLGISILTTNQGIMTNKEAKDRRIGGEIICSVW